MGERGGETSPWVGDFGRGTSAGVGDLGRGTSAGTGGVGRGASDVLGDRIEWSRFSTGDESEDISAIYCCLQVYLMRVYAVEVNWGKRISSVRVVKYHFCSLCFLDTEERNTLAMLDAFGHSRTN